MVKILLLVQVLQVIHDIKYITCRYQKISLSPRKFNKSIWDEGNRPAGCGRRDRPGYFLAIFILAKVVFIENEPTRERHPQSRGNSGR